MKVMLKGEFVMYGLKTAAAILFFCTVLTCVGCTGMMSEDAGGKLENDAAAAYEWMRKSMETHTEPSSAADVKQVLVRYADHAVTPQEEQWADYVGKMASVYDAYWAAEKRGDEAAAIDCLMSFEYLNIEIGRLQNESGTFEAKFAMED